MMGNTWEWVQDCWSEKRAKALADDSSLQVGKCDKRVIRGASWFSDPRRVRSAMRYAFDPDVSRTKVGFCVARDL